MLTRTYKYRLYPNAIQQKELDQVRYLCCNLYNACLQQRRDAWEKQKTSVSRFTQNKELPSLKKEHPEYAAVNAQVLQNVMQRVDRSFQAFYRRCKTGVKKKGYPRFKSVRQYSSFTYPQMQNQSVSFKDGKLRIAGITGRVKINIHRPLKGIPKTATFKKDASGKWWVTFVCTNIQPEILPKTGNTVGLDVGLTHFATLDNGDTIENPRWLKKAEYHLRKAQRKVSKAKRNSNRRKKAVIHLAKKYQKVVNCRQVFLHRESKKLIQKYDIICIEDLKIKNMCKGFLSKSIHDVSWATFFFYLTYKAESAGREIPKANPRGTSQECICGHPVPKTLAQRWHYCANCGLSLPRDRVSAMITKERGLRLRREQPEVGALNDPRTFENQLL